MSGQGNNKTWADIARPTKEKFPPKEELEKCISNSREEIRSLKEQLRSVNQKLEEVSKKIEDVLVIENSEGLPSFFPGIAIAIHGSYIRELDDEKTDLHYDEDFLNQDLENAQFNLNWAKKQLRELEKISSSNE
jgi:hypothetical protein